MKRAIVIIPGIEVKPRGECLEKLTNNLYGQISTTLSQKELTDNFDFKITDPEMGEIDVIEAYWVDFLPQISEDNPLKRIWYGTCLLFFWFVSTIWLEFKRSKFMAINLVLGSLALLLWYYTIIAPVLNVDILKDVNALYWMNSIDYFSEFSMSPTTLMAICGVPFVGIISNGIQISFSIRSYLKNIASAAHEKGVRDRIQDRIRAVLRKVYDTGYDEVILIGHSFGCVIAIDMLSHWQNDEDLSRTTFISWGSPADLVRHKSKGVKEGLSWLAMQKTGLKWFDVHSKNDFMCSYITAHKDNYPPHTSVELAFESSWLQRLSGETHMNYFVDPKALGLILTSSALINAKRA